MKTIKVSHLWTAGKAFIENSVIFNLFKNLANKEVVFTSPLKADLLILGPYNLDSISHKIIKGVTKRINNKKIHDYLTLIQKQIFFRKIPPLTVFYSHENFREDSIKCDFSITDNLGVIKDNHLRFPYWKENINWSEYKINRSDDNLNFKRFGGQYCIDELSRPQGNFFLKKKDICIFSSHMIEPRRTIYEIFSKNFNVDGFGPYFDKDIKNHNSSNFSKKDIMVNYSINLCPNNFIYPGYYGEKVPEAFLGKCLPVTWCDQNINLDFNEKAFVNLNYYFYDSFKEIIYLLKQKEFLEGFSDQPLLIKKPDLSKEIEFIKKILSCL